MIDCFAESCRRLLLVGVVQSFYEGSENCGYYCEYFDCVVHIVSVLVSYCDVPAADYFLSLSPKASLMVVRIVTTTVITFRMSAIIFDF